MSVNRTRLSLVLTSRGRDSIFGKFQEEYAENNEEIRKIWAEILEVHRHFLVSSIALGILVHRTGFSRLLSNFLRWKLSVKGEEKPTSSRD